MTAERCSSIPKIEKLGQRRCAMKFSRKVYLVLTAELHPQNTQNSPTSSVRRSMWSASAEHVAKPSPLKENIQIDGGRACRLAPRTLHRWLQAPNSSERHPALITYSKLSWNGFLGPELHRFYCSDHMKPIMKLQRWTAAGGHLYWNPYCNGLCEM